jgi:type IV pilus assembly protein PilQ
MIKFSLNQIKFLSTTSVLLLSWQSMVLAGTNLEKKVSKQKELPLQIAQTQAQQDVLVPNPKITIDGKSVDQTTPPPFLPRAVAPPVGDIAVSNLDKMTTSIKLGTTALIPRLVLRDAPATEVLALLSRAAGLNVVFTNENAENVKTVSLDLENEPIEDVFNNVLLISGLKANRQGNTIFVGNNLPNTVRNTVTRTLRINQYSAIGVATFLSSQGATASVVEVTAGEGESAKTTYTVKTLQSPEEKEGSYFMLKGLTVHADPIHDAVTLVGEAHLVQTATHFIRQLDIRRRQVAVNVKVVDVDLTQTEDVNTSFFAILGDTAINLAGGLSLNFIKGSEGGLRGDGSSNLFEALFEASISSGNAKLLTDPTLIVQEGQVSKVELVDNVLTSIESEVDTESGVRTTTPVFEPAGLSLEVAVAKIDDNGFVNVIVNPEISAPQAPIPFIDGDGNTNFVTPLSERKVSSGLIRLRDGQTLVLSGIISDNEQSTVNKVPILGDLPLLGALFRSTVKTRDRSEVIVLLTPQILDDSENNSGTGYNYDPTPETQEFLDKRGLTIPSKSKE